MTRSTDASDRRTRRRGLSQVHRIGLILLISAAMLLVAAAAALANHVVIDVIGTQGDLAGQLQTPRDVAVNEATGDVYVSDNLNHRIQRFDSEGDFELMWGRGVLDGSPVGQICSAAQAPCADGSTGTAEGEFDDPQGLAVNQTTGDVYVRDRDNRRVQQFDADGNFIRAWGFGVDDGTTNAFQICTSTCFQGLAGDGVGQFGTSSTNSTGIAVAPPGAPAGVADDVFVVDPASTGRRILRFDSDGTLDANPVLGSSANFGTNQPIHVAADAAGIVYASDSNSGGHIDRFDANATTLMSSIESPPLLTGTAATATAGLEVDPDSDGGGTDEDVLYALRDPSAAGADTVVQQFGPVNDPGAATAPTAADATHGQGAGLTTTNGLGRNSAENKLYISTTSGGHRVFVFDDTDAGAPTATINPVTTFDAHSATFTGEVNPNGGLTGYHFEYVDDAEFQAAGFTNATRLPSADADAGSGTTPVTVDETTVALLDANTLYHVRLVAKRSFGPETVISGETTFTASLAPPSILVTGHKVEGPTEATLRGRIHPQNSPTSYFFEWGTDTTYGNQVPATPQDIGGGNDVVHVAEPIDGLEPDTSYHFRLVAENEGGVTEGPDRSLTTPAGPPTPGAERAYEMVSPVDKGGGEVGPFTAIRQDATIGAAPDGHAVAWISRSIFLPGTDGGSASQTYVSTRGETGWSTHGVTPPLGPVGGTLFVGIHSFAEDLSKAVVETPAKLTPDSANLPTAGGAGDRGLYLRDGSTSPGTYTLLSTPAEPLTEIGQVDFNAATPDLGHVVFRSSYELLPGHAGAGTLYEWANGELRIASVLPSGEPATGVAGARSTDVSTDYPGGNPISADGSRIYFTVGSSLYLRQDASETQVVSASEREGDDPEAPTGNAEFLLATADGSQAFFTSPNQLTDDATAAGGQRDLYRWDAEADVGERLTDLTTQDPEGGGVVRDAFGTDDGSHVYFVATGDLAPGAGPGENNLYLWRQGEGVRHVATLDEADQAVWSFLRGNADTYRDSRLSEDGEILLFASRAQLTEHQNDGHRQVYVYDATGDEITCVSCSSLSEPSTADATLFRRTDGQNQDSPQNAPLALPRNLSADGSRVLFETPERLVAEDTNGRIDVYGWERGELELVSDGQSPHDAGFIGASADGADAFFITRARLVGTDQDDLADVYNARVGGGFPEPRPERPCVGDECQGPSPTPPADAAPGSSGFAGPGNRADARDCDRLASKAERLKRKAKRLRSRAKRASGSKAKRKARGRAKRVERKAKQARREARQCRGGNG